MKSIFSLLLLLIAHEDVSPAFIEIICFDFNKKVFQCFYKTKFYVV